MKRINFFSESSKGMTYQRMAQISAALIGLFFLFVFVQTLRTRQVSGHHQALAAEIDRIKATQGIGSNGAEGQLSPVDTVIVSMVNEPNWPEVLRVISKSIPEGIWLENIVGESSAEGGKTTLEGIAYQTRLVPGFLDHLRAHNVFSKVHLFSSEATTKQVDSPLRFKVQTKTRGR